MKNKIIYTFTPERMIEFRNQKNENDIITTCLEISEGKNYKSDFNYYIDISNFVKSNIEINPHFQKIE